MYCPICKHSESEALIYTFDDRYGYPGTFCVHKCGGCEHLYLVHSFSPIDLERLYTNYYPRSKLSVEHYEPLKLRNRLIRWFNGENMAHTYVPRNVKVLDIGCGFGGSIGYHKSRGCDAYGVEADSNVGKLTERYGLNIKIGLFDSNDYQENFFDYITLDQVLEHTVSPNEVLSGVATILKPGGNAIITIPNARGWGARLFGRAWINWHTPYHLHFFSKTSLQLAARNAELEISSIKTHTSSEWLHYQWMSLVGYPGIGDKSIFWDGKARNVKRPSRLFFGYGFFTIVHRLRFNHIITRFFDLIGMGDCFVIVLRKNG